MTTRILLADDHKIVLEGLCALLEREPDLEVAATVANGTEAVQIARELKPDVVVMDLSMPGGLSGIEATRLITAERPGVKVLCLSMHSDSGCVMGALDAGASGYVLKDSAKTELLDAVRAVIADKTYLSPTVAGSVVSAAQSKTTPALEKLTERERQVLQLLAEGVKTKEIAHRLHLSVKTVGTHRRHIMEKLESDNIATLTKFAIREGLTSVDD